MAALLVLGLLMASLVSAGTTTPSNSALPPVVSDQEVVFSIPGETPVYTVTLSPLTVGAGLGLDQVGLNTIRWNGSLIIADATTYPKVTQDQIAVVSCDLNETSSSSFIDASYILNQLSNLPTQGVILYSVLAAHCDINGTFGNNNSFGNLMTTQSISDAMMLVGTISSLKSVAPSATVLNVMTASGAPAPAATATPYQPTGPSTAVAMSILYSITAIITVLFLVIIATGAVRAHRHPERYGPRVGNLGRSRQSRAKGLARAMLETLPIVKFGDPDPPKPGTQEIELEHGREASVVEEDHAVETTTSVTQPPKAVIAGAEHASGMGPNTATSIHSSEEEANPNQLGCSICTEDFTKGEDVRVLPCNHKYHPLCIDPWLLNISGTCPLCRVDLRPVQTHDSAAEGEDAFPPPLSGEQEAQLPGYLSLDALREMPPAERLAYLQHMRIQRRDRRNASTAQETAGEERSRTGRLTSALRDRFHIRTRSASVLDSPQLPVAGSSSAVAAPTTEASPVQLVSDSNEGTTRERGA